MPSFIFLLILLFLFLASLKQINEYERGVVYTMGRFAGVEGGGRDGACFEEGGGEVVEN